MRLLIALLFALPAMAQTVSIQDYVAAPEQYGPVIMLRHALAPGGGDPNNFDVNDCSTQRNLSDVGRAQSLALGESLRQAGYAPDAVYSSPWCRCYETAELMDLGAVQKHPGLASFFQGIVDRESTLKALDQLMSTIEAPTLMVTHFVTISAVTGRGVSSGEAVVYDPKSGNSWALTID